MAYISLFQNEKWWSHSAYSYGYISMEYSHWREGTNQCYQINYSAGVSSGAYYKNGINIYVILDGVSHVIGSGVGTGSSSSWYQEGTGWYSIANKTSGTTSFYAAVYDAKTNALLWAGGTTNLNVDNAYPTVTTNPYITGRTINTLSFNIGAVNIASNIYYSLDNKSWTHATSENIKISNLTAGTTYTIYVQYRNQADNSLSTTATCQGTTLPQALISSPGQGFTLNSNSGITIKCTNNSGCSVQYYLETYINGVSTAFGLTSSTTATSYTFSADVVKTMLSKIPNANSCTVRAVVATVINGNRAYYSFTSGTLKVVDSNPTFSNWTYEDVNSKTLALTGNNQIVIKGYSSIRGIITSANKAISKNYAIMTKYRLTIGNASKENNYSSSATVNVGDLTATSNVFSMYAIDSRTNSTLAQRTLSSSNYKEYFNISIDTSKTKATRKDKVGSETTLNVEGKIWNSNFGKVQNSINTFTVEYKLTSQTDEDYKLLNVSKPTLSGNTFKLNTLIPGDLDADGFTVTDAFNIRVKITDALSPSTYVITLGSGKPNLAVDKDGVAINKPYDTDMGGALQVNGQIVGQNGGGWWQARDRAIVKNISHGQTAGYSFNPLGSIKTSSGSWEIGNLSGNESLYFSYVADNDYNTGNNANKQITLPNNTGSIPVGVVLYDNASGTTGTVTLSTTSANFSYLEIYAKHTDGYISQKVLAPNGKKVGLIYAWHTTENSQALIQYVTKRIAISGTSITVSTYGANNVRGDGVIWVSTSSGANTLSIVRVVGYR